ncbi:MAG: energy transducer TonB, partial [Thiopseudomonas sp.]
PSTDQQAVVQDELVNEVSVESTRQPAKPVETPQPVLTTQQPRPQKVVQTPTSQPMQEPRRQAPVLDREQLSADIASLEAEFARERQQYAKRPRISHQHTASTKRDVSAWYRDDWRKKVERIGNLNYPDEARRNGMYGSLRLLVVIRSDGSIDKMAVLESSGQPVLDQAALNIVRLSAPFAPFSGELAARFDQVEIIRTWRFERGDRLSSH